MPPSPDEPKGDADAVDARQKTGKLGTVSGVYIPVCLSILSILMFLRFGFILGRVGFVGILGTFASHSFSCICLGVYTASHQQPLPHLLRNAP